MNVAASRPDESFKPLQVAGTIRQTSVALVEPSPNLASQIIKSGTPRPHATVNNPMVARVDSYTPPPGRNLAHYLAIDVDKAGNDEVSVTDALQRYLGVAPTRKPGGDPKNVASLDSFPTLVMAEDREWADAHPYRFSVNGVVQRQAQPSFYTLGGAMRIRLTGSGVAAIQTPATEGEPPLQVGPIPPGAYYPPALAAQLAMRRLTDLMDDSGRLRLQTIGPDLSQNPDEALAQAAEAMAALRAGPKVSESVQAGLGHFASLGLYDKAPGLKLAAVAASA
jgi:hypothetical protein